MANNGLTEVVGGGQDQTAAAVGSKDGFPAEPENQRFWRQLGILPPSVLDRFRFVVVGAGATGSWISLVLAKMGARHIEVWDHDRVDDWNASNQVYSPKHVGRLKVEALAEDVAHLAEVEIRRQPFRVEGGEGGRIPTFGPDSIVVAAVDNMAARRVLWEAVKSSTSVRLFIDPRMGAEGLNVYAVNPIDPQHQDFYERNWHTSDEAEHTDCGARSIVYTGVMAAAMVTSLVKAFVTGRDYFKEAAFSSATFRGFVTEEI